MRRSAHGFLWRLNLPAEMVQPIGDRSDEKWRYLYEKKFLADACAEPGYHGSRHRVLAGEACGGRSHAFLVCAARGSRGHLHVNRDPDDALQLRCVQDRDHSQEGACGRQMGRSQEPRLHDRGTPGVGVLLWTFFER